MNFEQEIESLKKRISHLEQSKQTTPTKPKQSRPPNEYAKYVKEHMSRIREANPGTPPKDLMKLIADDYRKQKNSN